MVRSARCIIPQICVCATPQSLLDISRKTLQTLEISDLETITVFIHYTLIAGFFHTVHLPGPPPEGCHLYR